MSYHFLGDVALPSRLRRGIFLTASGSSSQQTQKPMEQAIPSQEQTQKPMEQALPSQEQTQKPMEQALPSQEQSQNTSSGDGSVSVYTNFAQKVSSSDQEEKAKDTMATYQITKTATAPENTVSNYRTLIAAQPTFRQTSISPEALRAFSSLSEKPSVTFFPSLTGPVLQQASPVLTPAVPLPPVPQISPSIPPDVILPEVVEEPWYKTTPGMAAIGIGIIALLAGGYALYKSQGA